ncbi:tyrosine-type recombinase/integrase [Methylobacterium sp. J-059]|uniref:tyrosine-type recombinase/integrase n=1 Tax=Methylobacterium sp. J-059 TaxID=2836643 RepID=UPI001FBA3A6B|nr:tyrosine-type recombinase/integrase [Methylobacterium sp. J-059]MCJ2041034.1 tyrosine-type recombinase/integrase [Methylobacterium sp. J-059]
MSNDLILIENLTAECLPVPIEIQAFADQARDYADQARSMSTRRSYASDVRTFSSWCEAHNACPLPASTATVLAYLIDGAGRLKVSTLRRHLVAIRKHHAAAGHVMDTGSAAFNDSWRGIQRDRGRPADKKAPLVTDDLRRAVEALPATLTGKRDRALILVGFAAALRRSELASLEVMARDGASWIADRPEGLVIHLGRTKTDQGGVGAEVGVPFGSNPETCPVRSYRAWLKGAKLKAGPAFRPITRHGKVGETAITGRAVARIVKRAIVAQAMADGVSRKQAEQRAEAFAGHSLRSGLATSAAANDAPGHAIQRQLRHRKFDTTAGYIRSGKLFKQNAAGMAGL